MWSLPLFALPLFTVVVCTAATAPSPPATPTPMEELLANGGRRKFKSFKGLYLTDEDGTNLWALGRQDWGPQQDWTIVQINNNEVKIKSNRGNYIGHGKSDWAQQAHNDDTWEMLTPVKNTDGTWSFKSRWNKWLSAHSYYGPERYYITFESENKACEHWLLEPYPSQTPTLMDELLAHGGGRRFKSFNELYLTNEDDSNLWALGRQDREPHQEWIIVQINNNEVAIKSNSGNYIGHGRSDWAKQAQVADTWEMLTPVKNADGSWSFKSRWNKWLSAHTKYEPQRFAVNFENENKACEHWRLEPLPKPAAITQMEELMANGGRRRFKAYNEEYLINLALSMWTTDEDGEMVHVGLGNHLFVHPSSVDEQQHWTIEQLNDKEVAIKSFNGLYIKHASWNEADFGGRTIPQTAGMFTPVKNVDGSWSFKSRWGRWLSTYRRTPGGAGRVDFQPENLKCEHWKLEPY